ncbi:MAG: CoA-binding protein [Gallionella sp.]
MSRGDEKMLSCYLKLTITQHNMLFDNSTDEQIRQLLQRVHNIAVIGLSPNTTRPSFRVASGLQSVGFRIIPVRPLIDQVLGEKAFPDLESLPELPDIVDVFRAAEHVPSIVESCIKLGIKNLWLQEGVIHETAAQRATEAGITVVMNRCMWRDYVQLCDKTTKEVR